MVHYVGKQKCNWKKYLLIGACLAFVTYTIHEFAKSTVQNQRIIQVETIDTRLDSILSELRNNPEFMDRNYKKLTEIVEQELVNHPDYANRFIITGLEAIDKSSLDSSHIKSDTYIAMFERIKDKAEEKPEIMDHFGVNAKAYMEKEFVDKYLGTIEKAYRDVISNLEEKSKPVIEALGKLKGYIIKNLN